MRLTCSTGESHILNITFKPESPVNFEQITMKYGCVSASFTNTRLHDALNNKKTTRIYSDNRAILLCTSPSTCLFIDTANPARTLSIHTADLLALLAPPTPPTFTLEGTDGNWAYPQDTSLSSAFLFAGPLDHLTAATLAALRQRRASNPTAILGVRDGDVFQYVADTTSVTLTSNPKP